MQFPIHRPAALTVAGLIVLLVAACTTGSASGGVAGATDAGGGATIGVVSPADGAQVSIPFDVQLEASVPLGEPESGNHHAHLYFDTSTDSADYDIVYGTSWQVTRQLAPGEHTIIAALANPDHSLAGPTQTITIVVGEGASAPGDSGGGDTVASPAAPPTSEPAFPY